MNYKTNHTRVILRVISQYILLPNVPVPKNNEAVNSCYRTRSRLHCFWVRVRLKEKRNRDITRKIERVRFLIVMYHIFPRFTSSYEKVYHMVRLYIKRHKILLAAPLCKISYVLNFFFTVVYP